MDDIDTQQDRRSAHDLRWLELFAQERTRQQGCHNGLPEQSRGYDRRRQEALYIIYRQQTHTLANQAESQEIEIGLGSEAPHRLAEEKIKYEKCDRSAHP